MQSKSHVHIEASTQLGRNTADTLRLELIDKLISLIGLMLMSPVLLANVICALVLRKDIFTYRHKADCWNRSYVIRSFSTGIFKSSAMMIDLLQQKISFFGLPSTQELSLEDCAGITRFYRCKLGLFNSVSLNQKTGLETHEVSDQLIKHLSSTGAAYVGLILRSALASLLYTSDAKELSTPKHVSIFGLAIDNVTMQEAIDWTLQSAVTKSGLNKCKTACFVNVNSVNQCASSIALKIALNRADKRFADGSGVRLAAKHMGYQIRSNVNGTDMLPLLCEQMCKQNKSLYLLGAAPGVAKQASERLQAQFPNLKIVGVRHGYFNRSESSKEVALINQSKADVVLVALGSPHQEKWLLENANKLNCKTALAVGGLLDFYADKFSRAPMWLRELGMEWVWRLLQDPATKFSRYVIGNPVFLFRTYFTQQARRGF